MKIDIKIIYQKVNTYTIEVSLLGYELKDERLIIPYTDELYAKIGRNVTRALWVNIFMK